MVSLWFKKVENSALIVKQLFELDGHTAAGFTFNLRSAGADTFNFFYFGLLYVSGGVTVRNLHEDPSCTELPQPTFEEQRAAM